MNEMNYNQQQYHQVNTPVLAPSVLPFGILSLVFCWCVLGFIFAIIGRKKANAYIAAGGMLTGQIKTGRILSTIGLVLGIIGIIFSVIWIVAIVSGGSFVLSTVQS